MFAEKQPSLCLGHTWANTRELLDIVLFQSLTFFKCHAPLEESDETLAEEVVVLQINHIMFHFIIYDHPQFHDLDRFFRSTQLVADQRLPASAAFSRRSLIERLWRVARPSETSDFGGCDLGRSVMLGNWIKQENSCAS